MIGRRSLLLAGVSLPAASAAFAQCVTDALTVDACLGGVRLTAPTTPPGATLNLNFMTPGTLDPLITFTRASTGTYFDSGGVLQTAGLNLAFPSVPVGGGWTASTATPQANAGIAPDGSNSFVKILNTAANSFHGTGRAFTITAGQPHTVSVYAKVGEIRYLQIIYDDGVSNGSWATFDLQTGTIAAGLGNGGASTSSNAFIVAVGGGVYRCGFTATVSVAGTSGRLYFINSLIPNPAFYTPTYAGTVTDGLYIWGAQVELGPAPTQYAPTTTAANSSPRWDYDPVSLQLRGLLLEDQRTNGIRNSTMQGAVPGSPGTLPTNWLLGGSPGVTPQVIGTGAENGIPYIDLRFVGTTAAVQVQILPESTTAITAANGQAWSNSLYLRLIAGTMTNFSTVQLFTNETTAAGAAIRTDSLTLSTPTSAPLASQRQVNVATLSGGGTVGAVHSRIIWNMTNGAAIDATFRIGAPQMELGALATSFIPTTSAAVTRSIDSCLVPSTNMAWFTSPGGSWFAEFNFLASAPSNSRIIGRPDTAGGVSPLLLTATRTGSQNDGVSVATANAGTANAVTKGASTWAAGQAKVCLNGGSVASSAALATGYGVFATSGVRFLSVGAALSADNTSGWLRRVSYWPRVLADAEMQQVTT